MPAGVDSCSTKTNGVFVMKKNSIQQSFFAFAILCAPVCFCVAQGVKFESMAPKGSALIISAKDANASMVRYAESPIGQIMRAPEIAPLMVEANKETALKRSESLQELGVDAEEVPWPGPTGAAIFVERDEELDALELGLLVWADYGPRADVAGKIFDAVIRKMEKESGKSFEQVEIAGGTKAMRIVLPNDDEGADPQDPQPPSRRRPRGMDALGQITALPEAMFYVRVGTQFFAASSVATLEDAIASASGKPIPCVADTEDWRGMSTLIGDQDVSIVFLTAPIQALLTPVFAGPMASAQVVIKEMFGDIRGWAITTSGKNDQAILDIAVSAYIPGAKIGLMDLLSDASPIMPPPTLLGDDAVIYQRMNVRFGGIMAMIEDVVASLPENEADAIAPMLQQYGPGMTKAFTSIGPEVFTIGRKAPEGVEGIQSFTAIRCTDEKTTNALLATMLPSMGMMPRDFQGQIVYGGEGLGSEIGLGGGALVMGADAVVEQALRSASDPAVKSLGENPLYRKCLASLAPGEIVGWGYADVPILLDQNRKAVLALDERFESDADDADADKDGDSMDVLVPKPFVNEAMKPALEKIDLAMLNRYFGPLVWDIRSQAKGLQMRAVWLKAVEAVK